MYDSFQSYQEVSNLSSCVPVNYHMDLFWAPDEKNTVFNLFQRTLPQCSHVFSFPGSIIQEMFLKCL